MAARLIHQPSSVAPPADSVQPRHCTVSVTLSQFGSGEFFDFWRQIIIDSGGPVHPEPAPPPATGNAPSSNFASNCNSSPWERKVY